MRHQAAGMRRQFFIRANFALRRSETRPTACAVRSGDCVSGAGRPQPLMSMTYGTTLVMRKWGKAFPIIPMNQLNEPSACRGRNAASR